MAAPTHRTSKAKKRSRRGHLALRQPSIHLDPATGEYTLSHHVLPDGSYNGHTVKK